MTAAVATTPASQGSFAFLARDFTASIVVFLVAMPLCMGIAVASGVSPDKGLLTGIIGGLVVGLLAGSPLQVSGPAAGLAVIVFDFVSKNGIAALGPVLLLAGALQLVAGALRAGGLFRSISPAVVHGMLAGIGALIVIGQFHTLFDAKPLASGPANLAAMPGRLLGLSPWTLEAAELALVVGLITIVTMVLWDKFKPASLRLVPGALLGVLASTLVAWGLGLAITRVSVPDSLASAVTLPGDGFLGTLLNPSMIVAAVALAFIASAETLLSAAAVDRMHNGVRTDYNKELRAQGIGNALCGLAGALPMTGVIVRSSANVHAGAVTRISAILHGVWILGFVALLPWLLEEIPMAALGGVLVVTGWKLVNLDHVRHLFARHGALPAAIWAVTFGLVVTTDLLTGVLAGIAMSALELIPHARRLGLHVDETHEEHQSSISLRGVASFLHLTRLLAVLEKQPAGRPVRLDLARLDGLDHTAAETLSEWLTRRRGSGDEISVVDPKRILKAA